MDKSKRGEDTTVKPARAMPGDFAISLTAKGGVDNLLRNPGAHAPAAHARL